MIDSRQTLSQSEGRVAGIHQSEARWGTCIMIDSRQGDSARQTLTGTLFCLTQKRSLAWIWSRFPFVQMDILVPCFNDNISTVSHLVFPSFGINCRTVLSSIFWSHGNNIRIHSSVPPLDRWHSQINKTKSQLSVLSECYQHLLFPKLQILHNLGNKTGCITVIVFSNKQFCCPLRVDILSFLYPVSFTITIHSFKTSSWTILEWSGNT